MKLRTFIVFVAATLFLSAPAFSQNTSAQEAKKAKLEKEIAVLDKQLAKTRAQSKNALSQLTVVRKKVSLRKELVAKSEHEIRTCNDRIYEKQKQINLLQKKIDTLSLYYSRLVQGAYRNRDTRIWYMYILASDNISQAFRRYSYFKNLSANMKQQAVKLREARAELEAEKMLLGELKAEAETAKSAHEKEVQSLQKEEKQSETIVNELKKDRKKYESQLAAKKNQVEALNREIQRIIASAMKKPDTKKGKKTEIDQALAVEFSANKGKLPWPADGSVVGKFGQHYHPVFTNVKLPFNNGIDIAVAAESYVNCVFNGVVKQIVILPGYNQCVLVQHGNYFSLYCKLRATSVKSGDKVKTGQRLGIVDTIGGETQVHLEIWKDQSPQNPELWLK